MKKGLIVVIGLLLVLSALTVSAVECGSIPTDGCEVTVDTTFEPGTYNLPSGMRIGASNIILDCDGAVLDGEGSSSYGIYIPGHSGVTIKNCNVRGFNNTQNGHAIYLYPASNNTLTGNNLYDNRFGIYLRADSNFNVLTNNTAENNYYGIYLHSSSYNTVSGNTASNNFWWGIILSPYSENNLVVDNIANNNMYGIYLNDVSSKNIITGNTANNNGWTGIFLLSSNNILTNNIVNDNTYYGIAVGATNNNVLTNNTVDNSRIGIDLSGSNNTISSNVVINNNYWGISLYSENNLLIGNFVNNNNMGIVSGAINATILYNNIYNNAGYYIQNHIYNTTAEYNYWGTTNCSKIDEKIYDYFDNSLKGIVDYEPFLDAPYPLGSPRNCILDDDNDDVSNDIDICPETPEGEAVNEEGCSCSQISIPFRDCPNDQCEGENWADYQYDGYDICEAGEIVEEYSCEAISSQYSQECDPDDDDDGVLDGVDLCPNTKDEQPKEPIIYGCSCKQILDLKPGEDKGELKKGCSKGTINVFTKQIGWAKDLFK